MKHTYKKISTYDVAELPDIIKKLGIDQVQAIKKQSELEHAITAYEQDILNAVNLARSRHLQRFLNAGLLYQKNWN